MKVLVTGSHGFIGSHLVKALREKKHNVRTFDIAERKSDSILNKYALENAMQDIECVFHLAALKSVSFSFLEPYKVMETNGLGTLRVLETAKKAGVKRVIYSSSSSIYGGVHKRGYSVESDTPYPLSPYAISKLTGEYYCQLYTKQLDLPCIILRYFNVYGPGQQIDSPYASVIPKFISSCLTNKPCEIYGDGKQTRNFTYVSDVINANLLAMKVKDIPNSPLNIAGAQSYSLLDFVDILRKIFNFSDVTFKPARNGDVIHSQASLCKAQSLLQYKPQVDFRNGLEKMVEWMRK